MRHDYVNFGFDEADAIIAVGYELQEFDPVRINPNCDKKIIHIHRFPAEVDLNYEIDVGLQSDIAATLDALAAEVDRRFDSEIGGQRIREMLAGELDRGAATTDSRSRRRGSSLTPGRRSAAATSCSSTPAR